MAVAAQLGDAADGRGHDREAVGHRLEHGEREPLGARGQEEDVGRPEQVGHVGAEAEEAGPIAAHAELSGEPLDARLLGAVAHEEHRHRHAARLDLGERAHDDVLSLERDEAGDVDGHDGRSRSRPSSARTSARGAARGLHVDAVVEDADLRQDPVGDALPGGVAGDGDRGVGQVPLERARHAADLRVIGEHDPAAAHEPPQHRVVERGGVVRVDDVRPVRPELGDAPDDPIPLARAVQHGDRHAQRLRVLDERPRLDRDDPGVVSEPALRGRQADDEVLHAPVHQRADQVRDAEGLLLHASRRR